VLGASFGFLWWNAPPAKIFMGDTGSLALGGTLAGLAIVTRTDLLLLVLCGLFVIVTMSVVIQVSVFKATKRTGKPYRVFRMTPLQHHFELLGWAETTIVIRFWLIAGMFVAAGLGRLLRRLVPQVAFICDGGLVNLSPRRPGGEGEITASDMSGWSQRVAERPVRPRQALAQ